MRQPRDWDRQPTCEACSDDGWVLVDNLAVRCACQTGPPTGRHRVLTAAATSVPSDTSRRTVARDLDELVGPSGVVLIDTAAGRRVGHHPKPERPPSPTPACDTERAVCDPPSDTERAICDISAERPLEGPLSAANHPRVGDDLEGPNVLSGPLQASIDRLRALSARKRGEP